MNESPTIAPKSLGRLLLWLGIVAAIAGIVAFGVLTMALHILHTPWYTPVLGTIGAALVLCALMRRRSVTRFVVQFLSLVLAALEWWFVTFYVVLPHYSGPVAVGQSFSEFSAELADGTPFTRADLSGSKNTVLVFFRGWW
ncbi:MAG: hypothetical protein HY040_26860 [Planctomycetes bacterium]|nr:hypothetical protein [Planctomycetota bacterium]